MRTRSAPLVVAHRGRSGPETENSIAAIEASVRRGVEAIEVDVRRTADAQLVLAHDPEVAGLTLAEASLEELRERSDIATLAEALEAADELVVDVELKVAGVEDDVLAAIENRAPRTVASSFLDATVARMRSRAPALDVGLLLGLERPRPYVRTRASELWPRARLEACGATFAAPHFRLVRPDLLRMLTRVGLPAWVWTVNEPRRQERLLGSASVGALITDEPLAAVALRADTLG